MKKDFVTSINNPYLKDYANGSEGFTLAAVLMFGKDHVIKSVLPYHRVDTLLRKVNIDWYDDRDDIRTNLLDSYEGLIDFVHKHLPDKFYLEGMQRISIRDIIFREIITNLLIHREYSNAYPSKWIIGANEIISENASKPHGYGPIDPRLVEGDIFRISISVAIPQATPQDDTFDSLQWQFVPSTKLRGTIVGTYQNNMKISSEGDWRELVFFFA